MKTAKTLDQVVDIVNAQQDLKRDIITSTDNVVMTTTAPGDNVAPFNSLIIEDSKFHAQADKINSYAHGQIANFTGVPKKYYDMITPEMRAYNVNARHQQIGSKKRLFRMLGDTLRADLSNRYRCWDNIDMLAAVIPTLYEYPDLDILACEVTETRMYIKVSFKGMHVDLPAPTNNHVFVNDTLQSGVIISNSEVGSGAIMVAPFVVRLLCLNGMTVTDLGQRRNHVGKQISDTDEARAIYSDETMKQDDELMASKLRDTIKACVDQKKFEKIAGKFAEKMDIKMADEPIETVTRVCKKLNLSEFEAGRVQNHLMTATDLEGQRNTGFGVINAITRTATDVESYDRSSELEKLGGDLTSMDSADFNRLLNTATKAA